MRVIIKRPNTPPAVCQIGEHYTDLQRALVEPGEPAAFFEKCLDDGLGGVVWCDEEYLIKGKRDVNFRRPGDGHPICGSVVVTGTRMTKDGPENADLTDEQVNRWMYLLVLMSAPCVLDGEPPLAAVTRRQRMLDELYLQLPERERELANHVRDQLSTMRPLTDFDMQPHIIVTDWDDQP